MLNVYGSITLLTEQGTNPIYEMRGLIFNKCCVSEHTRDYQKAEAKGAVEDNTVPCSQQKPFSFRHLPRGPIKKNLSRGRTCIETKPKLKPENCRFVSRGDCCEKSNDVGEEDEANGNVDQLDDVVRAEPADRVHVFEGGGVQQKSPIGVIVCQIDVLFTCQGETKDKEDYGDWNDKPNGN